ncbi:MoaD/ThiS family protein [Halorussus amylolyticus]|uniref:MoaD/ThiS family protein n=1 Tax=Halorussus amylolyticus TaxID=1126242 RepID=UPI00104C8CB8|nr:MoaD/ThiS family protein [Halorussus amylolyticus]
MSSEECDYCGEGFDDEEAYLRHLRDEHGDDLGPIEVRRVAALDDGDDGNLVLYAGAVGVLIAVGLAAYLLFFSGGGSSGQAGASPHSPGSVHYHGPMTTEIGGEELDFSRQEFQYQNDHFHFESGDGSQWHVHSQGVTLAYAMDTLGINVTENTVSYDGTTYRESDGDRVVVEVNGEPVTTDEYVLQEGDAIRVVAEESN